MQSDSSRVDELLDEALPGLDDLKGPPTGAYRPFSLRY